MATYEENMYNYLKRQGLEKQFDHSGIYCIKVDGRIVYVGKSYNMLRRMAQHKVAMKRQDELKYRILAEVQRKGCNVRFDVLYNASSFGYDNIQEEIGRMESELIRRHRPMLNTQIPHADNWRKFDIVELDATEILNSLLKDKARV